jgi:hypothetical protein
MIPPPFSRHLSAADCIAKVALSRFPIAPKSFMLYMPLLLIMVISVIFAFLLLGFYTRKCYNTSRTDIIYSQKMHRWSKMDLIYYKSEYDLISSDRTDEITPPHAHESLEIIHFKKGTCITNINGNEIECLPGNLIVIFPNTVHSHKCSPDCKYQIHIIALDILEEFQHILFSKMPEDPLIRNPDAYALKLFEDIFRFGDSLSPVTKKGLLLAMVSLILEDITFSEKNNRIANIGKIIDFCNNHFKEKISLNTLSKEIGISRSHISHTFPKE